MWGKRELRAHLQERLGVGERQLQRLVAKRAAELPSTTDEALYVLAHENGLRLQNYLTPMQIADVRALVQGRSVAPAPAPTPRTAASRKSTTRSPEFIVDAITVPAGVLSERHFRDATLMAKDVYPLLYAFENSAREFIDGHLVVTYGSDWWDDSKLVSTGVRRTVEISRRAERDGRAIDLRPREYELLEYLLRNQGRVLTKTMILSHVWGYNFNPGTNVVDVLVSRLREKIDRDFEPKLLHTVRGVGYVLKAS